MGMIVLKSLIAAVFALGLLSACMLTTGKSLDNGCEPSVNDLVRFCTAQCKAQKCVPAGFFSRFPFRDSHCACFCPKPELKLEVTF